MAGVGVCRNQTDLGDCGRDMSRVEGTFNSQRDAGLGAGPGLGGLVRLDCGQARGPQHRWEDAQGSSHLGTRTEALTTIEPHTQPDTGAGVLRQRPK